MPTPIPTRPSPSPLRPLPTLVPGVSLALALAAVAAPAADDLAVPEPPRNRWQIGARAGFNLDVDFRNRSLPLADTVGPLTGTLTDRTYADGFVRPDASASADGSTWNWGYQDASQVPADLSRLSLHGYTGTPYADSLDQADDPQWGAETTYARMFGDWAGATWGFEIGVQWTSLSIQDDETLQGSLTETTDAYALNGILPPTAPYAGSFNGPGPILDGAAPTRTLTTVPTVISGRRELEGNLLGLHLGPVLDIPLGDWLSAQISGGLALGWIDADLNYRESASLASGGLWTREASVSDDVLMVGGYLRGQITVRLSERLGWYAGAEFQSLASETLGDDQVEAKLGFDAGLFVSSGLRIDF